MKKKYYTGPLAWVINRKKNIMSRTSNTASNATARMSATVNGRTIRPLYSVSELKTRTRNDSWIVFTEGNTSNGVVVSGTLTRDEVRSAGRQFFGTPNIHSIRAQRVSYYRANA